MPDTSVLLNLAYGAVALLVAALGVYLAFNVLGKFAKILLGVLAVVLVGWLLLSPNSPVHGLLYAYSPSYLLVRGVPRV